MLAQLTTDKPLGIQGPIPSAPTLGTGTSIASVAPATIPTAGGSYNYTPTPQSGAGGVGVVPFTPVGGPEIITAYGGGGGLQVPIPNTPAPQGPTGPTGRAIPGTSSTGTPGVPNAPVAPSAGAPGFANPQAPAAAGFSLSSVPVWGWIAGAVLLLFLLKD